MPFYSENMIGWFRDHPYGASAIVITLILVAVFVVQSNRPVEVNERDIRAWGNIGSGFFNPTSGGISNIQTSDRENIYSAVQSGPPFFYDPSANVAPVEETSGAFDFDAFIASLTQQPNSTSVTFQDESQLDPYSFIPTGLISIEEEADNRTPTQLALYEYGNQAGSHIKSFESALRSAPRVLKDQFEDREDPAKNAALVELADGLTFVGASLERIGNVPPEIEGAHKNLIESYKTMGEHLARIPEARREQAFLDAILSYNQTVEAYVQDYVALAVLFSAHGVVFSKSDPGSVFTFSSNL